MNKLLLLFFLLFKIAFGQETKYLSEKYEFKNGEIAYMFGNDVKLRNQPNIESNVLSILKIGEKIKIIEKSNSKMIFEGIESFWYKVKTNDNIGFVFGGLISLDRAIYGNLIYLTSLKKEGLKLFVKTRVLENQLNFKENISQLLTGDFSIKATGNKGVESIKSIFEIDYFGESCGVNSGGIYLFYDGNELVKAIDYTLTSDGDYSFVEELIFPNDKGGIKGKIVFKREIKEKIERGWTETKTTRRIFEWNGEDLSLKMKTNKR